MAWTPNADQIRLCSFGIDLGAFSTLVSPAQIILSIADECSWSCECAGDVTGKDAGWLAFYYSTYAWIGTYG